MFNENGLISPLSTIQSLGLREGDAIAFLYHSIKGTDHLQLQDIFLPSLCNKSRFIDAIRNRPCIQLDNLRFSCSNSPVFRRRQTTISRASPCPDSELHRPRDLDDHRLGFARKLRVLHRRSLCGAQQRDHFRAPALHSLYIHCLDRVDSQGPTSNRSPSLSFCCFSPDLASLTSLCWRSAAPR